MLGTNEQIIQDYVRRIKHLQAQTIPNIWGNAGQAVPAYMLTLQGLRKALSTSLTRDIQQETTGALKELSRKVRSMESRLKGLEPRTISLKTMVERIEKAHDAADQLPTDLETLEEARHSIGKLAKQATKDQGDIADLLDEAEQLDGRLKEYDKQAESVLAKCESAYSAATSVGLAAAFTERSEALSKSMWIWVAGLVIALTAGSFLGSLQLQALSDSLKDPNTQTPMVILNLALSLLSVGAPVWFSWLATKQIGQRFRLSEDYAFKASVSRAYEGFRREAARFDEDMEARLLTSALTRLDELPLRLVEPESHGSPWHEVASSDTVKQAMKAIPGFAEQVKDLASNAITDLTQSRRKTSSKAASKEDDHTPE